MKSILIVGATSSIASEIGRLHAHTGDRIVLVARNASKLIAIQNDLKSRGAESVEFLAGDLTSVEFVRSSVESARVWLKQIDVAYICHGTLPSSDYAKGNLEVIQETVSVNVASAFSFIEEILQAMEIVGSGKMGVISSVAGDRGRKSNYLYGATKAAVSVFLEGIHHRFAFSQISITDIRPGFVDTAMTANVKKGALFASAERVARDIVAGVESGRRVLYTPPFWRVIMFVVRSIPHFIFKRLNF